MLNAVESPRIRNAPTYKNYAFCPGHRAELWLTSNEDL